MTWKEIEASRETRLWIRQVAIPAVAENMANSISPEARQTLINKCVQVRKMIHRKLEKRG